MLKPELIFSLFDSTKTAKYYADSFPVYFNIKASYEESFPVQITNQNN